MSKDSSSSKSVTALREEGEKRLSEKPRKTRPHNDPLSLIHELEVHEIELEMQNEELRRAQLEIEKSQEKYFELYDFAPVGYLTFDEKGMISELNLAAAGFLGMDRKYLVNKLFHQFIKPEFQDAFYLHRQQVLKSSTKQTCELVLKKNDGTFFHAQFESISAEVNGQRIMRSVLTDITERKQAEEQLRQTNKMEAIGTLAGGIAHDFNNSLAAILGFTEMAIEDIKDPTLAEKSLNNVLKAALRSRELVKQILIFSGKSSHARSPMSLIPLIAETIQFLRASIPKTIKIIFTRTAASDTVFAAPVEVQQILMNLAANAALAMEKGGTLEISLIDIDFKPESPLLEPNMIPGEYLQLIVKDTGIGMSPEVMKRVFEPFFTTRKATMGTGMGLAVVHGIVKDLQGTITMESEPGVGSVFRVSLPKVKAEVKEERAHTLQAPRGTERILFVDDEDMLVEWGRTTLERLGYSVIALTDSREALKTFSFDPSRFDLIITDQSMPSMAGLQLAKELLKIRPDIPIILCTGHSETVSPEKVKKAGIRQFLMKPLAKQELAEAVRKVLDGKQE